MQEAEADAGEGVFSGGEAGWVYETMEVVDEAEPEGEREEEARVAEESVGEAEEEDLISL
ncbi:hypothetical protein GALMADRAFT_899755 [Galerina marginata CBS 339.88]|uniref:Uncharacterized protein n=1 Tax=Galerina marginata (strain CBS 339.88) TaxID=685588 RepID=A0A067SQP3_GALM3|nr:hypothetical protein GALMADRAFT_899755 [Galerina marginata CBS 339.88]